MKSKTKKIILFSSIAVFLCAITAVILIVVNRKTSEDKKAANKKFDENNIGEVYCASIDEKHIAVNDNGTSYIDNEILVVAKDGVSKSDIEELAKENDAQIVGYIEQTGDYQLQFSKAMSENELDDVIDKLKKNDKIISAGKNSVFTASTQSIDYDINPGKEWNTDMFAKSVSFGALTSTIEDKSNKAWGVTAIRAPQAWTAMNLIKDQINPVNVGLIDSGFFMHDDLGFAEMFYENGKNRVDVKDEKHGTHVAGIMAAKGNNKEGICGVYPYADCKLYGASWAGADQYNKNKISVMKEKCCFSELIFRNVKVINCSYGFDLSTYYDNEASLSFLTNESKILADYLKRALKRGYDFVIVSAAGNESDDIVVKLKSQTDDNGETSPIINNNNVEFDEKGSPTIVEKENGKLYYQKSANEKYEVIGIRDYDKQTFIANRDYRDGYLESKYASFLNAIPNEKEYENVYKRIVVVGSVFLKISNFSNAGERVDIFAPGEKIYSTIPENDYDYLQGTSMAAPHVAGVCANVWSIDNSLSGEEVKKIVCNSWVDDRSVYKTPDTHQDRGVVDCLKAVEKAFDGAKNKDSTIAKTVSNGAVLGWIYETDDKTPIENAKVTAQKGDQVYTATTDTYGHFELIVPGGEYTIVVSKAEYNEWRSIKPVTVNNGEVCYYNDGVGETIRLEKKSSEAETIAKMIVENEKTWHKTDHIKEIHLYDGQFTDPIATTCWFEDLDFDGIKEFVVGPVRMEQGQVSFYGFDIYKINNTKLKKMTSTSQSSAESSFIIYFQKNEPFEVNKLGMYLYKDNNQKYHYAWCANTSFSIPYAMNILEADFSGIKENQLFSYLFNDPQGGISGDSYYSVGKTQVSLDKLIERVKSELNGAKQCTVNTKQVALTNQSGDIAADCYSKKTKEEKIKMLVESYNSYKIVESDKKPDFLEYMLNKLEERMTKPVDTSKLSVDELQYKEILDQHTGQNYGIFGEQIKSNEIGYAFYDLNDDGIKELLIIISYGKKNSGAISELYSIVDNKPKLLLSKTFVGSSISIAQDNSIVLYNRFSAFSCWYDKYNSLNTLLSSEKPEEIIDHDIYSQTSPYTYSIGGNKKTISGSEFQSIVNKWTNNSKTFSIKLFSEYK